MKAWLFPIRPQGGLVCCACLFLVFLWLHVPRDPLVFVGLPQLPFVGYMTANRVVPICDRVHGEAFARRGDRDVLHPLAVPENEAAGVVRALANDVPIIDQPTVPALADGRVVQRPATEDRGFKIFPTTSNSAYCPMLIMRQLWSLPKHTHSCSKVSTHLMTP